MVSASNTNCSHIIRQCEILKTKIQGKSQEVLNTLSDESIQRQKLANLYKNILLNDLSYSLEKKVELELWNSAFKCHIDNFRMKAKDKRVEKNETQAKLSLFLDASAGFYFQLLQEFCSTYELDLPFYGKSIQLGIFRKPKCETKKGKLNALLYICQDCLVHLGDLARYRNDIAQAESFYSIASKVLPGNGQPYNQLAILASAKGNQPLAVYHYFKSISVPNSFPAASSNLSKTLSQLLCSNGSQSHFGSTSSISGEEFIDLYLQWTACIFLGQDIERAVNLKERLTLELKDALQCLSQQQILVMISINIFNLLKYKPKNADVNEDDQQIWSLILSLHILLLKHFVEYTLAMLKTEQVNLEDQIKCLPALKILFDWIFCNSSGVLDSEYFQDNATLFYNLALFGNLLLENISWKSIEKSVVPLKEDWSMHGLTFLRKVHKRYDFKIQGSQLSLEEEHNIRVSRVLTFLDWLVLQKQTARFIIKKEDEETVQYVYLQAFSPGVSELNEPFQEVRKSWHDVPGNIQSPHNVPVDPRNTSQSFPQKTRSLFRTDSEDSTIHLMSNVQQQQPMAPYSLFNSMWNANLQRYSLPPAEVVSNTLPSTNVLSTINRVNQPSVNQMSRPTNNQTPQDRYPTMPQQPQAIGEQKRFPGPPGLSNMPLNNVSGIPTANVRQQNPLEKDGMPLYQSFSSNPPLQSMKPVNNPIYTKQGIQMRNPVQVNDTSLLHSSPLLGGFADVPPPQQGFGVIGQNMRLVPSAIPPPAQSMYPASIQRPTLSPAPDIHREVPADPIAIAEGNLPENRSIWSSNFGIGHGELSPLEQLLQEQRRHQRLK